MPEKTCININFDSLGWSLSASPKYFLDPTFFHIADRFFGLSNEYNFRYTIFVIGKDLENPQVAERVKEWSKKGHEIANHSYSHKQNLGYLDYSELETEVMKSHELITKVTGKEPRGFGAPAWATSANLVDILLKNGYLYDTSVFPSYFIWLVLAKARWNFRNDERKIMLERRGWINNLLVSRKPYFANRESLIKNNSDGLLIIPLPVTPFIKIPCWHTMSFFLPGFFFNSILKTCLNQKYFYYVVHPTDLFDRNDIPANYRNVQNLERLDISLERKWELFHFSIQTILKRSLNIVTLESIAEEIISEKKRQKKRI